MKGDRIIFAFFFAGCAFYIGLLVFISYFNWPNAEDLSLTLLPRDIGLFNSIKHMMGTYDGRYFMNLLHGLNPLAWGYVESVWLMTPFSILLLAISLYYFISTIFVAKKIYLFFLSVFITSLHFATCPSIAHQLFWMSSSFVYLYSILIFLLFLATYIRYLESLPLGANQILLVISLLLLFCGVGMNEMLLPAYSLFLVHQIYRQFNSIYFKELLPIYVLGFCSILFFVASPGIQMRLNHDNYFENPFGLFSLETALRQYFTYLFRLLKMPLTIASLLFLLFLKSRLIIKEGFVLKGFSPFFFFVLVFPFLLILPYYVPLSHFDCYPDRIYGTINLVHLLVFSYFIFRFEYSFVFQYKAVNFLFSILLFVSAFFSKNNVTDLLGLYNSGELECFKEEFLKRNEALRQASNAEFTYGFVELDTLKCVPEQFWIYTDMKPGSNESHWNKAYQNYYHVDEVVLKGNRRRMKYED
jgi:hypothetical protein